MARILVTGAEGFIGSHLVEHLVRDGNSVRAFVLYNSFGTRGWLDRLDPQIVNRIDVHIGDIRDSQSATEATRGCEVVYHLAALIGIPYSYSAAESYVSTNVFGTLNLLRGAMQAEAHRFIQTSTSEVYGTAKTVPISEDHSLNAQSPYAATKIAADQMALSFQRSFGLPVTVVRPFNTYGPRQSARAVIPTIISQITAGHKRLQLGALRPTRDFNYVEDTAMGMIAAAAATNTIGETVNLCTGYEISIGYLVSMIADMMQANIEIDKDEQRLRPENSEVERLCGDGSKMLALTGWKPAHGGEDGLCRGIRKTIDWFSKPANAASYRPYQYAV